MRNFKTLLGLMFLSTFSQDKKFPMPKIVNSGLSGWTGFMGKNKHKKHFNKKRHGKALKRKHKLSKN